MHPFADFFSSGGRLAPRPFARLVIALYLAAFVSQILVSPPALSNLGPVPFALAQALTAWSWFCLHAKRLRDSKQGAEVAASVAVLYALAVILLLLVVAVTIEPARNGASNPASMHISDLFVLLKLFAVLTGDPDRSLFDHVALAGLILILAPVLVAIGYSIYAWRQPSILPAPAAGKVHDA